MKPHVSLALALVSTPVAATAAGAERCPALPVDSGFEWQYEPAIDFHVCRAKSTSGGPEFFGLYVGLAANFRPEDGALRENGVVGGYDVVWYATRLQHGTFKYVRQTLFNLPRSDSHSPEVHVWIDAVTAEQLVGMKRILASVNFSDTL